MSDTQQANTPDGGETDSSPSASTRRYFMQVLGSSTLLLSGCGGGSDAEAPAPSPSPAPAESGIFLLAGTLGGVGLLPGRGRGARLPPASPLAIAPDGTVYMGAGSPLTKISPDAEVQFIQFPDTSIGGPLAVNAQGQLYCLASGVIARLAGGTWEILAGQAGGFERLDGMALEARLGACLSPVFSSDTLYFIDMGNPSLHLGTVNIRSLTAAGAVSTLVKDIPAVEQIILQADGSLLGFDAIRGFCRIEMNGKVTALSGFNNGGLHMHSLVPAGNLAFHALEGKRVVHMNMSGQVRPIAGVADEAHPVDGVGELARFGRGESMIGAPNGDLLLTDQSSALRRVTPSTQAVTSWAGRLNTYGSVDGTGDAVRFSAPASSSEVNATGTIYLMEPQRAWPASSPRQVIRKVTQQGEANTLPGTYPSYPTQRFAVDTADTVFFIDGSAIMKMNRYGKLTLLAGKADETGFADGPGAQARFALPSSLLLDASGNLWVGDAPKIEYIDTGAGSPQPKRFQWGNTIRRISPSGEVSTAMGTPGRVVEAPFSDPVVYLSGKLFLDAQGRLYNAQRQVWRFDAGGPTLVWPGANNAELITISPSGEIFVLLETQFNQGPRIYTVEADGQLRTVAGSDALYSRGVRLGALPGTLNSVTALHAVSDKLLLVLCENSILRINL